MVRAARGGHAEHPLVGGDITEWWRLTPEEWQAVRLSLAVALRSVAVSLLPAVLVAWLLARRRFLGRPLLDALVHLPLVVPPVVVGWALLLIFGLRGPIGSVLDAWFGVRLVFTTEGAALATAVMSFPLIVRAVRLSLEAVDPGLEAAARTLGAGPLDRFATVTLPLMAPGVLAGAVIAFAAGLGEFGAVITFVSNIPGETQTMPLAIYAATQTPGGEPVAARLAAVSFALALLGLLASEAIARRMHRLLGRG
jgi:molybdate transport system permease protein